MATLTLFKGDPMRAPRRATHPSRPAAQYLRVSTEHQRYSMRNQARAIVAFAAEHGYHIVQTYADPGRSGLTLRNRPGLKALLADAVSPERPFSAILVLDVSRWGRFQDLDQSAHYEFVCREAGVRVVYCAESFENDGSPTTVLVKQIKRLMAAEYSRELSAKVRNAQLLQAGLGYKQGGLATYGFRRLLIDRHGQPVQTLATGQRKILNDHRVVYVRGPDHEVAVIRDIFRMYIRENLYCTEIANRLNDRGMLATNSAAWTHARVRGVLKNQLVVGDYVYNLTSQYLGGPHRRNPPNAWIRTPVVKPIISRASFELVQLSFAMRSSNPSEADVLWTLRHLLRARGHLSTRMVDACPYTPGARKLKRMFGSLYEAYRRIGYSAKGNWPPRLSPADEEKLLDLLRRVAQREGRINSKLIDKDASTPCASTYRKHFGSLLRAYQLAGLPYNMTEIHRRGNTRWRQRDEPSRTGMSPQVQTLSTTFSDEEMLDCLRRLYQASGYISSRLVGRDPGSPSVEFFEIRFGSMVTAYAMAGLPYDRTEVQRRAGRLGGASRKRVTARGEEQAAGSAVVATQLAAPDGMAE